MAHDDTQELRRKLWMLTTPSVEIPGIVKAIERLEKLDRGEPSGLAERVGTLEEEIKALKMVLRARQETSE